MTNASNEQIKVAIIGCGKIADQHVAAIDRIPGSRIVAACDREILMAEQLAERFSIPNAYTDSAEMLADSRPDVVHITTPPGSHFPIALQCLQADTNVYLEKPFTLTGDEAEELIRCARERSLKITAGHNYLFTGEMLEMRELVGNGYLGGNPVHLESHWGYDLSDRVYVGAILNDQNHWVRKLPGRLFHNLISHGIARIAEFLDDDISSVDARAFQSDELRSLGGGDVLDELRVMIRDSKGTTAYFTFSTQIQPGISQLLLCGPKASLLADQKNGSLIRLRNRASKSYLVFFAPPLAMAWEYLRNSVRNVVRFLRKDLYQDFGMKELIERFHKSISQGAESHVPIPEGKILLTARLMDEIFSQVFPIRDPGDGRPRARSPRDPSALVENSVAGDSGNKDPHR